MLVHAQLKDNEIIQEGYGSSALANGNFVLQVKDTVGATYLLPIDGNDLTSLHMMQVLAENTAYSGIYFNPLLTTANFAEIDASSRVSTGIGATSLLAQNNLAVPAKPGELLSTSITIPDGGTATKFMVYWQIYACSTSHDYTTGPNAASGVQKTISYPADQDPSNLVVHLISDGGLTETVAGLLTPITLSTPQTSFKVRFRNTSTLNRVYIAHYAVLYG